MKIIEVEENENNEKLKIIGVGLGKTGTNNLKFALNQLGYKTYHMSEIFTNSHHVDVWLDALQKKEVDWDSLFENYDAAVDWPTCYFYKELIAKYPNAKVILTERDAERWYNTCLNGIFQASKPLGLPMKFLLIFIPKLRKIRYFIDELIWKAEFSNQFANRDLTIKYYRDRIDEIKRVVPPSNLLCFSVEDGWGPLCEFLDVAVPRRSFPQPADGMQKLISITKAIDRIGYFLIGLSAVAASAAAFYYFKPSLTHH